MQPTGSAPPQTLPGALQLVSAGTMEDAREAWTTLAVRTMNIFSTWEWANLWWKHFGVRKSLDLVSLRQADETVALLPITTERRRGIRVLRFLGHGVGDQLGPVCGSREIPAAVRALRTMLSQGGILLAERMPADRDWARDLHGKVMTTESAPVIDLAREGDWDSYLQARSSNFRQQVRRRARKLQRGPRIHFRLADDPKRLPADFDTFLALHRARWGPDSAFERAGRQAFHREFAAQALERGWLRLWFAEADGVPVAAWYGFRFAGVESYYQSGRDPRWDRAGVGAAVLEHSIHEAFVDGMLEYRLLRGDEPYKHRYLSREESICTIAAASSPLGRTSVSALQLVARSRMARRLLGSDLQ